MPAKKPLNMHVMTKAFRVELTAIYAGALKAVGVTDVEIKPHLNSSATVRLTDAQLESARSIEGMTELSAHGNSGAITIVIPQATAYLKKNRPTLTPEAREARKRSGTGTGVGSKEEQERRRKAREELDALLKEQHGIDLSDGD